MILLLTSTIGTVGLFVIFILQDIKLELKRKNNLTEEQNELLKNLKL